MERRAKERLIGAAILVVLAVLVVPELLSGPRPAAPPGAAPLLPAPSSNASEPTRTVTVDLATRQSTSVDSEGGPNDSAAAASAPPPVPATSDAAASTLPVASSSVDPKPLNSVPLPAPSRTVDSPVTGPTSSRNWALQLGSFANRGNADNLVHRLKSQGLPVYDSAIGTGQAQRFRVRVGPLPDRAAADRTLAKLKALGHTASMVPPSR